MALALGGSALSLKAQASDAPAEDPPTEQPTEQPAEELPAEEPPAEERPTEEPVEETGRGGPPAHAGNGRGRPEMVDEMHKVRDQRRALQEKLVASRDELLEELANADATEEEIKVALEQWREENADDYAELRNLRRSIREVVQANRPDRGQRGGPSEEVRRRREDFRAQAEQLREERKNLGQRMRNAETAEDRRAIIEEFREEQRDRMQEAKELRRAERRGGNKSGGDRRPDQ